MQPPSEGDAVEAAPSRSGCCRRAAPPPLRERSAAPTRASRGRGGTGDRRRRSAARDLRPADRIAFAVAARKREREQDAACDEVPHRHREERREVADGDRERDERRAPDEVDRHQGEPDPRVRTRRHAARMRTRRRSAQVEFDPASISAADRSSTRPTGRRVTMSARDPLVRIARSCRASPPRHHGACPAAGRTSPSSS